jgi:hypothetical protein
LPQGEDAALWRVPFSLAGLEPAVASGEARVHIEATASGWVLRASGADGVTRTARVAAPQTAAEREEVAFLARGLLRAMEADAAVAPGPLPVKLPALPPPPPSPPSAAAASASAQPPLKVTSVPAPRKIGPVEVVPEGGADVPVIHLTVDLQVAVQVVPEEPRFDPIPERHGLEPVVNAYGDTTVNASGAGAARRRKDRRGGVRLDVPPLILASGTAWRPQSEFAFLVSAGMDMARVGETQLGWDVTFLAPRGLPLEQNIPRQFHALDWELDLMTPLTGWMRVGADAGASFRWYRQQNTPIANGLTPVAGVKSAFGMVPVGTWALDLIGAVKFDLAPTRLVRPDGSIQDLVPVELRAEFSVRWWGRGDPFAEDPTSKR